MAEIQLPTEPPPIGEAFHAATKPAARQQKRGPSIHQIYALPAPIRTFPLPTFYPNNPISLCHVAYAWLGQLIRPPPTEPAVIHQGIWSETTISVHITDEKSMRALWEQGFYGKGNLSRSEPNWLKREQVRRGLQDVHVSEILTVQRREERAQAKWERARLEQEAIRQTRLEEEQQAEVHLAKLAFITPPPPPLVVVASTSLPASPDSPPLPTAPIGPLEILALPNSLATISAHPPFIAPVFPLENSASSNLAADVAESKRVGVSNGEPPVAASLVNGHFAPSHSTVGAENINGTSGASTLKPPSVIGQLHDLVNGSDYHGSSTDDLVEPRIPIANNTNEISKDDQSVMSSNGGATTRMLKRQKSVRFSPTVESTTYKVSDPPSPNRSPPIKFLQPPQVNGNGKAGIRDLPPCLIANESISDPIINKEHLQLMPEEVFFLAFGLGVLRVTDPVSGKALSSKNLFTLFRQYSYFPPRNGPDEPDLEPDDGFLVHYAVYHHFRSLGWVPRAGIKFGVDWLLYARGPVFDHAEFGLIVIPSYSDPWWRTAGKERPQKPWSWLHSVVRVLSHVTKSLVLVYVDVPSPPKFEEALNVGITEAMKLYRVKEITVKRWSSNRNR